jgi:hypothetical protein
VIDTEQSVDTAEASSTIPLHRWVMAAAILFLNLFDVIVTKAILRYGGAEANPIMAPIMDHPAYPIILKTIVAVGVGALLLASPRNSKLADRSVFLVIVAYVIVMGWNFGILIQATGAPGLHGA